MLYKSLPAISFLKATKSRDLSFLKLVYLTVASTFETLRQHKIEQWSERKLSGEGVLIIPVSMFYEFSYSYHILGQRDTFEAKIHDIVTISGLYENYLAWNQDSIKHQIISQFKRLFTYRRFLLSHWCKLDPAGSCKFHRLTCSGIPHER